MHIHVVWKNLPIGLLTTSLCNYEPQRTQSVLASLALIYHSSSQLLSWCNAWYQIYKCILYIYIYIYMMNNLHCFQFVYIMFSLQRHNIAVISIMVIQFHVPLDVVKHGQVYRRFHTHLSHPSNSSSHFLIPYPLSAVQKRALFFTVRCYKEPPGGVG